MGQEKTNSTVRIDMLHGGIFRKLLLFALPLIASGILQQSFNSVDVAVVGQFASSQALAAVGSNGLVISLIINLFIGISIGANVVIAHYIGRQDEKGIKNAISTTAIIAVTSGIFLLITGLLIAKPILEALDTPEDVIDLAVLYLRIYSLGMPFMMIYNFGAAILRSLGDTKRPFYSLVVAGAINVGLNLLLVIEFEMSVAGVAVATVISNIVNAGIIVFFLTHEKGVFRLELKQLSISNSAASVRPRLTAIAVPRVYAQTALSKQMGWMPRMILSQSMPLASSISLQASRLSRPLAFRQASILGIRRFWDSKVAIIYVPPSLILHAGRCT